MIQLNIIQLLLLVTISISAQPKVPREVDRVAELPASIMETNDSIYLNFSKPAGFYNSPFELEISASDTSYNIVYTIDGSNPITSMTRKTGNAAVTVPIDPEITTGRGKTPAFIVRACLEKEGIDTTMPFTQTYIFLEKVKTQSSPGGNWPNGSVNGKLIDYDMAGDVINDNRYKSQIEDALLQIPSISICTDLENLFGPKKGIYVNSANKGRDWERECSLELINPDGSRGFQINAGVRIRGGNSAKRSDNGKNAFRLFFRKEYGAGKLNYPMFENEGADKFDCIDLRCAQNYSWSMDGDAHNTFIKDIFCRDLQGKMGQPYARGRYYHLYLNGVYWGLFQTDERPEASFAETYLGGDKEDYDVVKVNTQPWPYHNEATDGNMEAWEELWSLCQKGFSSNEAFFDLVGKDKNGKIKKNGRVLVDIDNLIDYMMIIFYSGNFDAPTSMWYGDDMPNNFYAIYNRKNLSQGFKFVAHDSEHCIFTDKEDGLYQNRVNIGSNGSMQIKNALSFNPQWLHYKLSENEEYRMRFIDRAHRYLTDGGILSPEKAVAFFKFRASQIDMAIIAESARWGDAKTWGGSLNKLDHWLPELNNLYENYFPYRTDIVKGQLEDEKLYTPYGMPEISVAGKTIAEERYFFSGSVNFTISNANNMGGIYYTLDNTDPRLTGGKVYSKATAGQNIEKSLLNTTVVKARVFDKGKWGPVTQVTFVSEDEDFSNLKITELCYHPTGLIEGEDTISDKKFEFIELKNTGPSPIDISGCMLDSAVSYTFPDGTLIQPGEFVVIASKPNWFYQRYGFYPSGNYQGQLSNGGEQVVLTDQTGNMILSLTYDDEPPWPTEADGSGSLVSTVVDPTGDPANPNYWKVSMYGQGSPFADDVITNIDTPETTLSFSVYPNPTNGILNINVGPGNDDYSIELYNLQGQLIYHKIDNRDFATINLKSLDMDNGIYFIRISTHEISKTEKILFIK